MDFLKQLEARHKELLEDVRAVEAVIASERRRLGLVDVAPNGVTVADKLTVRLSNGRPRGEFSRAILAVVAASAKSLKPIEVTTGLKKQEFDFGIGKTSAAARVSNELSRLFKAGAIRRRKGRYSVNKTGDTHG